MTFLCKNIKYIIPLLIAIVSILSPSDVFSQSEAMQQKAKKVDQQTNNQLIKKPKVEEVYDTEETLGYMGSRMLYQVKKRLHLTDESDEKQEEEEKKKAQKAKFTVFGLSIEKH